MARWGVRLTAPIALAGFCWAASAAVAAADGPDGGLYSTPILHKPVYYGSAGLLFLGLVVVHVIPAAIAPISAVVALATRKGSRAHRRAGTYFFRSMAALAITGIMLDLVRLGFYTSENNAKYAGFSMPSSYPARIAFLFAALCVLYLLSVGKPPGVPNKSRGPGSPYRAPALVILGGLLTLLIAVRYNPWTGGLWMIWTFMFLVAVSGRRQEGSRAAISRRHGVIMCSLAAFSWWGALQGFGPALVSSRVYGAGTTSEVTPYTGNLHSWRFQPSFWLFLLGWGAPFVVALVLMARFRARPQAT